MGKVKRPPAYLYRDRRRRLRRARRIRLALIAATALLALILLIALLTRKPSLPPTPGPTPAPQPTEPAPTPTPGATALPYDGVYAPEAHANITTEAELIDLYWWMIETGHPTVYLKSLTIPLGKVTDITDKFSNYFERYRAIEDPPAVRVEFKPGLSALLALQSGDTSALSDEAREVAEKAQAAVDALIQPGMTDWEKELALHDYVVGHCDYALDFLAPHSGDAYGFFHYGECRCAGYCDAFRLLGRLAGLEVEMIGGPTSRDANGSKGHAWNLIRLDGLWYVVDASWDDPIEDVPTLEHTFFNVPFACFGDTRSWDAACLPDGALAVALDGNYYYNRPGFTADTQEAAVAAAASQLDESGRAYLMLPDAEMIQGVAQSLARRYGKKGSCAEMSEDLNFNLYRLRLK